MPGNVTCNALDLHSLLAQKTSHRRLVAVLDSRRKPFDEWTGPASYCQHATRDATDRPAITDSSTVVPSGYLLFENGFTETGNQGQSSFDFPETLARFGLTSKTELRFGVPDYFQNFNPGSGFGSGWGDLTLGVKQQLVATQGGFNASLVVSLSFPTGANAISSHGYDPQFQLPWSHPISKNWTAAGMFSVLWPTEGAGRNLTGQASFLLDRQIDSQWDAFIEYSGEFLQRGGPQHILHIGTAFKITSNQQLDFHFGVGLSSAAVDPSSDSATRSNFNRFTAKGTTDPEVRPIPNRKRSNMGPRTSAGR
jgi:Putative MetA-pathway of phenol degradation